MQSFFHRNRVVLMHLSFWCVYFTFFLYRISSFQKGPEVDWTRVLTVATIQVSFAMLIGYLNYFIFLPRLLADRNGWRYTVQFVITFAILITLRLHLERFILDGYSRSEDYHYLY